MTKRTAMTLTISALLLGGSMVGCTAQHGGLAAISEIATGRAVAMAANSAEDARKAMAKHKMPAAVAAAENAVRLQPQNAEYRVLLGQTYLKSGRFTSARDAFADALVLNPGDGRAALNLALAQTASGAWDAARQTLDAHATQIQDSDRGLAIALAGDPASGVEVLNNAARQPGADAKTRQNLALALALSGRWTEARAVAAFDLGADQVDQRIEQWAAFAYPKSASDQVASLLGVTPVADGGQPAALALNAPSPTSAPVAVAAVEPSAPAPVAEPAAIAPEAAAPQAVASLDAAKVQGSPVLAEGRPMVTFAARREVVQPIPSLPLRQVADRSVKPTRNPQVSVQPAVAAKGNFYVQIGAYDNAAVAHDGWTRATRRFAAFGDKTPQGMTVTSNGTTFYRLSVGGFTRSDADTMCHAYRKHGGTCFVRAGAGDQVAQWIAGDKRQQVASR